MYSRIWKYYFNFVSLCLISFSSFCQMTKDEDKRARNRRIADSLYYIHTIKPIADSIQRENIKALGMDTLNLSSTKKIKQNSSGFIKKSAIESLYLDIPTNNNEKKSDFPCKTLYQNTWGTQRVKNSKISLRDIPDEVTIRLLGKKNEDNFCFPYKGVKTSGYGWRWGRPHTGLDIALNTGDKVYAAFDGVVRVACYNGGYGNMILIRHYNNLETLYGHLSSIKVKSGQKVKAGDVIGLGGSTGNSTGPHLHFECRLLYACFDPEWIVDINKYKLKTKFVRIDKSYFGLPASQAAADQRSSKTKLSKVNKLLDGTSYLSPKEFKTMVYKKELENSMPVKINNEDKKTWRYYHVKQGDSIDSLSRKYNIKKEDLIVINNLDKKELTVGQRIRIR